MPKKESHHARTRHTKEITLESEEEEEKESEKEEEFIVETIMGKRKVQGKEEYLIKWKGYSTDENTWEPKKNLAHSQELLRLFEESLKKKPIPKKPKSIEPEVSEESFKELSEHSEEEEEEIIEKKPTKKVKTEQPLKKAHLFSRKSARVGIKEVSSESEEKEDENNTEKLEKSGKGHFLLGDTPETITHCKPMNDKIEFTVSWKKRKNGVMPAPSKFASTELRRYNKDLLLDFYESKLKFVNSKKEKEK